MADFYLRDDLPARSLGGANDAVSLLRWAAEAADLASPDMIYRDREGRKTLRLELEGRGFFLKFHRGVGWREI